MDRQRWLLLGDIHQSGLIISSKNRRKSARGDMDAYHILLVFLCSEAIRMVCGWLYADTVVPHTRMI